MGRSKARQVLLEEERKQAEVNKLRAETAEKLMNAAVAKEAIERSIREEMAQSDLTDDEKVKTVEAKIVELRKLMESKGARIEIYDVPSLEELMNLDESGN